MDGEEPEKLTEVCEPVESKAGKGKGRKKIVKDPNQPSLRRFAPTEVRVRVAANIDDEWHLYIYQASDAPWRLNIEAQEPPRQHHFSHGAQGGTEDPVCGQSYQPGGRRYYV